MCANARMNKAYTTTPKTTSLGICRAEAMCQSAEDESMPEARHTPRDSSSPRKNDRTGDITTPFPTDTGLVLLLLLLLLLLSQLSCVMLEVWGQLRHRSCHLLT